MTAQAGLHCGFGDLRGAVTLGDVRAHGFTIVRITSNKPDHTHHHAKNMASPERCRELAQEVISAGLQPLISLVRAEQVELLPGGTLVEAGNEGDVEKFGWEPRTNTYSRELLRIIDACDQHPHELKCYGGAISNPHRHGLDFLGKIPWPLIPKHVGVSIHWYPVGNGPPTRGHDGRTREEEVAAVRKIVGHGRPMIVSEIGYHSNGYSPQQQADNFAWERKFWSEQGFELVVAYQINDGPPADRSNDARYGARSFTCEWKSWAAAFVGTPVVVTPPIVVVPPAPPYVPSGLQITLKSDHGNYLCAEISQLVVANRPAPGPWEHFEVVPIGADTWALKSWQGLYVSAELDATLNARAAEIGPWETWTAVQTESGVALKSYHGRYLTAELDGSARARAAVLGPWETWTSDPAGWWLKTPTVGARALRGPLRVENKLFRDDSGFRRVLFCSWFPALRILRDNPTEFERQLNAIVTAGYQGIRVFLAVGGWSDYWDGREVVPITFRKWLYTGHMHRTDQYGATLQAWPDYDDLLRSLLRACKARGLRLHVTTGDMQIICPNKQSELELHRRVSRICAEEGGTEVIALAEVTNEFPINRFGGENPESIAQMGKIIQVWEQAIPGVITAQGAIPQNEEPESLTLASTHGDVCAVHVTRSPFPMCLKRTLGVVYWENNPYRGFPKAFWQGEKAGPGKDSFDRLDDPKALTALSAMCALTGQPDVWFQGAAVRSKQPLESEWGFIEMPKILSVLPEDVATWAHGSHSAVQGIEYWWKGKDFFTSTCSEWNPSPPRPIASWTLYAGDEVVTGTGTPPKVTGFLMGRFS